MDSKIISLVDVNSMYTSCEALFRPDLKGKPLVAVSNNDGAIVARSPEAKAVGIRMGEPLFKMKDKIKEHGVVVFSSNYTLYGNLSHRIMSILDEMARSAEPYSIDESFLDLTGIDTHGSLEGYCHLIKSRIAREVGLPVCVGVSTTKTLAKLANRGAKKYPATKGVVDLTDPARQARLMSITDVSDVWGVGPRLTKQLKAMDIHTALDLSQADPKDIRRRFSVVLERTVRELNGEACIELEHSPPTQQQIVCSRSFGRRVTSKAVMNEALANFTSIACRRLRGQARVAKGMQIFIRTSPFSDGPKYANSAMILLEQPSDDTRLFLSRVRYHLDRIWRDGYQYAKAGIMLTDFYNPDHLQGDLFAEKAPAGRDGVIMSLMDKINNQQRGAIRFASEGVRKSGWEMKQESLSPRYTTRFDELPIARV